MQPGESLLDVLWRGRARGQMARVTGVMGLGFRVLDLGFRFRV